MDLKECLLTTTAITILIGISPVVVAWNPDTHRYESYDLDRGPVVYEAYYPDANEDSRGNYQEKQFFDHGAILEKTYQVPSQRLMYSDDTVQLENQRNLARSPPQDTQSFPPQTNDRSVDIKEISSLARRAITRDLENWNAIESYLDRAKYQNHPLYRRRILVPERGYGIEQTVRGIGSSLSDAFEGGRDFELYEEIGEQARIRSGDRVDTVRRLTPRDLAGRDSFGSIRYQDRASQDVEAIPVANGDSSPLEAIKNERIIEPYPTENIFAPRPQVIKYIFSKKPTTSVEAKAQTVSETKVTTKEPVPRSYGDNLIREEVKEQEGKDVKVTSIEVSEVPRHKTRHHHGEWPKRDYSKRHQS